MSDKVKTVFWESETKHSKLFKSKFGHKNLFIKWFCRKLELRVLSAWKGHFSVFCKFLSDKGETIFWESQAKHSKLLKSKSGRRKLLRKLFWSYLDLKDKCSERLKRSFFTFLQIFQWGNSNRFLGRWGKVFKPI